MVKKRYKREEILATPRLNSVDMVKADLITLNPFNGFDLLDRFNETLYMLSTIRLNDTCDENELVHMDRNLLENNEKYQQIVVGLIIRCNSRILLLKCINGDMSGNYTLIQGHVKYMPFDHSKSFYDILVQNINMEFSEEIDLNYTLLESKFDHLQIKRVLKPKLKFITFNNYDNSKISYYHIGYIFEIDLTKYSKMFKREYFRSGEPNKNKVEFVSIYDYDMYKFDNWVSEIARYYRYMNKINVK